MVSHIKLILDYSPSPDDEDNQRNHQYRTDDNYSPNKGWSYLLARRYFYWWCWCGCWAGAAHPPKPMLTTSTSTNKPKNILALINYLLRIVAYTFIDIINLL